VKDNELENKISSIEPKVADFGQTFSQIKEGLKTKNTMTILAGMKQIQS
jgi:hypothetical protein